MQIAQITFYMKLKRQIVGIFDLKLIEQAYSLQRVSISAKS